MFDRDDDNLFKDTLHLPDFNQDGDVDFIDYCIYDDILTQEVFREPTRPSRNSYRDDDDDEYDYDDEYGDDDDDDGHSRYDYQDLLPDNISEALEKGYIDEDDLLYEISNWYTDEGSVEDNCESIFIGPTYIDFDGCTKGLYHYLSCNLSIELENYGERILSEHAYSEEHFEEDDAEDDSESKEYEHSSRLDGLLDYDDDSTFGFRDSVKKESTGHFIVKTSTKTKEIKNDDIDSESETEKDDTIDADKEYDINNPSSFIVRNREKERSLGIKDIKIHCNWIYSTLVIKGEIIADAITEPFRLECRRYDSDGDLFDVEINSSYTGGSGFSIHKIMPGSFFNRYPFSMNICYEEAKIAEKIHLLPIKNEDEKEEEENKSFATIDVNNILSNPPISDAIDASRMGKNEKIPKEKIHYYIEKGIGLDSIKCSFYKKNDSDDDYYEDFNYTQIIDGNVKIRGLIYYLVYNEKGDLITYQIDDLYPHNYVDDCEKSTIYVLHKSKIGKIIIYVGYHPSNFKDDPSAVRELERALKRF